MQKSIVSYNSAATACGQAMQWKEAAAFLALSGQKLQELDCYSYTALISASTLAWRQAWFFFTLQDGMSATIEAFNSAMSCAKWKAAVQVLRKVSLRCLVPTSVSFNNTGSACAHAVAWAHAVEILCAMTRRRLHDAALSCTAATACIRSQHFQPALQYFSQTAQLAVNRFANKPRAR